MKTIYTTLTLSNGDEINVLELKGIHGMAVAREYPIESQNAILFSFHLAATICLIEGKPIGIKYLENLPYSDIMAIMDVLSNQMQKVNL